MGPFYRAERLQDSFQGRSTSLKGSHLSQSINKSSTCRRGQLPSSKEGSGGNKSGIPRILLKNFPCPKEKRENEIDHRPIKSKQICSDTKLQNGNTEEGQKCNMSQRLGIFIGPNGCLFAHPDTPSFQEVPQVLSERQDLPVSSPSFWSFYEPFCVHQAHGRDSNISPQESNISISIPRRLVIQKPKSSASIATQTICCQFDNSSRVNNQSREIRSCSNSDFLFHRNAISDKGQHSPNPYRQNSSYSSNDQSLSCTERSLSKTISFSSGETQCCSRFCCTGKTTSQTFTNDVVSSVETTHPSFTSSNINCSSYSSPSGMVEQSTYLHGRGSYQISSSLSSTVHRCQSSGLGSTSGTRRSSISRSLVTRSVSTPYKSAGNESNCISSSRSKSICSTINCSCINRQHNSCGISQQARRDSLPRPLLGSLENAQLVSTTGNCPASQTHSREIQHSGGSSIQDRQTDPNRMDPKSICGKQSLSNDSISKHRSICDTSESQTSSLCVTNTRSECHSSRCSHNELESHARLCIPSISSNPISATQNKTIRLQNCPDSSVLAQPIMVSRTSQSISRHAHISSHSKQSSRTITREVPSSKHPIISTSRMDIIKQSIRKRKFSREVANYVSKARRPSTRQVYDARWHVFSNWASQRKIDPIKASVHVIADFLIFLFNVKKHQVSTIKGYRSMITNTLKFRSSVNFGNHPVLSELIKSFQTQRPVERSLAPKWDLAFVLTVLCKEPFEPLNKASLKHLSMKTAFLLTMATAKRISEIHAFAIDEQHLRFSSVDGSLTLRTQPGFLAKNQLPSKAPDSVKVPRLSNFCRSNDFNLKLCPIRAIKIYLKRTKSIRGSRNRLFIPTKGDHDINKSTISTWIKRTIQMAYKSISSTIMPTLKPRAHELRALSASWAYLNAIPIEEIIKASVWSSSSTFAKFYLRDFKSQEPNLADLGPVVVAQSVVGGAGSSGPVQ